MFATKGKRILIVDDDETLVTLFQMILQEEGYIVETAMMGLQALDMVKKMDFHLVLLDIKLPDIMGDEVAKEVKKINDKTGIVLITGYPSFKDCIDALDIGIDEILLKPIGTTELLRVAEEAIQKHEEIAAIA